MLATIAMIVLPKAYISASRNLYKGHRYISKQGIKMMKSVLYKCPECKKNFPVNHEKHPSRKTIKCPYCRTELEQEVFDANWKPNMNWHQGKHKSQPFTLEKMRESIRKHFKRDIARKAFEDSPEGKKRMEEMKKRKAEALLTTPFNVSPQDIKDAINQKLKEEKKNEQSTSVDESK